MSDFASGLIGFNVHHKPNNSGHRTSHIHLNRAHQWNIAKSKLSGGERRKLTDNIRSGGKDYGN